MAHPLIPFIKPSLVIKVLLYLGTQKTLCSTVSKRSFTFCTGIAKLVTKSWTVVDELMRKKSVYDLKVN